MSSELERLLREARATLPEPDGASTRRARERALRATRRRRPRRVKVVALLGVTLGMAIALGVALGTLLAPSGTAASRPAGFGFLPEPGWQALQAAAPSVAGQPQVAMAANVPFAADDVVHGLAEPSALPYSTLLELPSRGVVIVVTLTPPDPHQPPNARYQTETLPLRVRDANPYIEYGTQLRPEQPLGQQQLRAVVEGHYVDVHLYFGTPNPPSSLFAAAQQQLDGLVVRPGLAKPQRPSSTGGVSTPSAPGVLDRTVVCVPKLVGGIRQVDTLARAGSGRRGSSWDKPALAAVRTTISGSAATAVDDNLVWVTAGAPSPSATVVSTVVGITFPMRSWGTLAVSRRFCRTSSERIPLSKKGLSGGAVGVFEDQWDCAAGRRVVVRVRAVLRSKAELKTYRSFLRTTVPVKSATIVVATQSGKTLSYAEVFDSGKSRLYTAPSCFPD